MAYLTGLLELALTKSGNNFVLSPVEVPPSSAGRSTQYLIKGRYDVSWMHTSTQHETTLQPIRIPLFKGLIGWRLMFIRHQDLEKFSAIKSEKELKNLWAGQAHNWPDNEILESNGFKLHTAPLKENVLQLLRHKRIDMFPRSITEIWDEYEAYAQDDIVVEPNLVITYPSAFYFFVTNENTILAKALSRGLNTAIEDGSFDQHFHHFFDSVISKSTLAQRTIIAIPNPQLSKQTPLGNSSLWFSPSEAKNWPATAEHGKP